jgi:bacterial/archaeal transporter family protein
VIAQPELPEPAGNPAQAFTGWMRITRVRIGRAHNFPEQKQGGIGQFVFFQNRIERNVFAVMPEFAIRHVINDAVFDCRPGSIVGKKYEFSIAVDKAPDQPRAGDAVDFNFLAGDPFHELDSRFVAGWFWYAVAAAILYGAHQIFTKLAADRIGEGLGGFVVEATAALSILVYLAFLWVASRWNQQSSAQGIFYSVLTGICVGTGTIAFFLLFQKGGPLSAVPVILAVGAAIMAIAGILFFQEPLSWQRLLGITLAIGGLFLLRR